MSVTALTRPDAAAALAPLFEPGSIAVAGASATGTSAGNRFIRILKASGYPGRIFPVHPTAAEIEGLPASASFADLPECVDYAYLTIPAGAAENALSEAAGKVRVAQVMASGDPGTQPRWEARLAALARRGNFRLIGPNCMGTHSPRGHYTFMEGVSLEPGAIGVGCQSGGLGMDILRRGQNLGLRFSGLVTLGNSIDVEPADILEYFLADPATRVVGLYVEDVKDGRRFQEIARRNRGGKPLVLLVGGTTRLGRAAAASHTGAMAGGSQAWQALARQTGIVLTETLDSFLDALQVCLWLTPKTQMEHTDVTLFGNGGGTSVLATDALDRAGLTLARPSDAARAAFSQIALPPGASTENPIDLPASVLKEDSGRVAARILQVNRDLVRPYATIVHLNLPVIMGYRHVDGFLPNLMNSVMGSVGGGSDAAPHQLLVLRSDRSEEVDGWRRSFRVAAAERGVPTFDEIPAAVDALAAFRRYEAFLGATHRFDARPGTPVPA